MLSALSRVQIDVIEFLGNASRQRLPVRLQDVCNPHGEPPFDGSVVRAPLDNLSPELV